MARMAFGGPQAARATPDAVVALALAPVDSASRSDAAWTIDQEAMGAGWHDSSWMLRRGLDVTEGVPADAIPPEWQWRWWLAAGGSA